MDAARRDQRGRVDPEVSHHVIPHRFGVDPEDDLGRGRGEEPRARSDLDLELPRPTSNSGLYLAWQADTMVV